MGQFYIAPLLYIFDQTYLYVREKKIANSFHSPTQSHKFNKKLSWKKRKEKEIILICIVLFIFWYEFTIVTMVQCTLLTKSNQGQILDLLTKGVIDRWRNKTKQSGHGVHSAAWHHTHSAGTKFKFIITKSIKILEITKWFGSHFPFYKSPALILSIPFELYCFIPHVKCQSKTLYCIKMG